MIINIRSIKVMCNTCLLSPVDRLHYNLHVERNKGSPFLNQYSLPFHPKQPFAAFFSEVFLSLYLQTWQLLVMDIPANENENAIQLKKNIYVTEYCSLILFRANKITPRHKTFFFHNWVQPRTWTRKKIRCFQQVVKVLLWSNF